MPKLPKFSELTDVNSMVNKLKTAFENMTGPSSSSVTEEALEKEKDPTKAKFLEVELLINQLHDVSVIQNKTIHELKSKYAEVKALANKMSDAPDSNQVKSPADNNKDMPKAPPGPAATTSNTDEPVVSPPEAAPETKAPTESKKNKPTE